ncbi:MAG TPA: hypothetical protein PKW33_11890 [Anaerolineaceae bacterium]|nr:hypothetical protein [Anaerolineaceae bacterium]HPN52281.1 hypothetical protein [Anaerolineaceae bacterium]
MSSIAKKVSQEHPDRMVLEEFETYLMTRQYSSNIRKTYISYMVTTWRYFSNLPEPKRVIDLTREDLVCFIDLAMSSDTSLVPPFRNKPWSFLTMHAFATSWGQFFAFCIKQGYITENPAEDMHKYLNDNYGSEQ